MKASPFVAALVQMRSGIDPAANLVDASRLIREAAAAGAQYVQTPEITTLMETERTRLFASVQPQEGNTAIAAFSGMPGCAQGAT